jgi:hypothetical protein
MWRWPRRSWKTEPGLAPAERALSPHPPPFLCLVLLAGGCPAASNFLLLRQKKVTKEKATRSLGPLRFAPGQPAVLEPSGVRLNSPSAQTTPALIRMSLRSSAQPGRGNRDREPNAKRQRRQIQTRTRQGESLFLQVFGIPPHPLWMRRGAQGQTDQGSRCLSVASLARPRLDRAPQVARSEAEGRSNQGRLFFCLLFFWRSKRKVSSRRATPGQPPSTEKAQAGAGVAHSAQGKPRYQAYRANRNIGLSPEVSP